MNSYSAFAKVYDLLTSNIDYHARAAYFDELIKCHGGKKAILLDLACGTGSLSGEFCKLGYEVIGIDSSFDMLSIAQEKKIREQLDIIYLNQAMQDLDLYGTVDVAVCALDSINHITDENILQNAFDKISLFLHPEGIFIFDINTVYKHQKIIGNNIFVYDLDSVYCVWQNSIEKNNQIVIHLDIFTSDGKTYNREEEDFSERAYTQDEMKRFLDLAGLKINTIYEADSFDPPKETSQRLIYVTGKVK